MSEVPEHLLRRSRERRAALGLGGDEEGSAAPEGAAAPAPARAAASSEVEEAPTAAAVTRAAAAPAVVEEAELVPAGPPRRPSVPAWAMLMLVAVPLWAFVYLGAFGNRTKVSANDPVVIGSGVFASNCATCHGSNGEGGVGPKLAGGEVLKVWPKKADHIKWVQTGGAPYVGGTIGATNVAVPANNVMPAFDKTLTTAQIEDVVCYERVNFGGAPETADNCPAGAATGTAG